MTTNNTPGRSDNNDPPEDTSLNSVLSALSDEGFSGQFIVASEARVLCSNCRSLVAAA